VSQERLKDMKHTAEKSKLNKIIDLIICIILIIAFYLAYRYYQKNNFNDFIRSEATPYTSTFIRDSEEKYSKKASYKIESQEYNDAMFYKTVKVEKNKPYKVTCMVKTKNIESKEEKSGVGAQISIEGTTERSMAVSGTQEWEKIELLFNSQDRDTVNIGFRLGGYLGEAKGEAWFSDFTLEQGIADNNNEWKFACFIFETTDVTIGSKKIKLNVTESDVEDITNTIERFQDSCGELSQGKMTAKCDVYKIENSISKLSYDTEFGYYVAPEDIEEQIKNTIEDSDYDHIFVVVRLRR